MRRARQPLVLNCGRSAIKRLMPTIFTAYTGILVPFIYMRRKLPDPCPLPCAFNISKIAHSVFTDFTGQTLLLIRKLMTMTQTTLMNQFTDLETSSKRPSKRTRTPTRSLLTRIQKLLRPCVGLHSLLQKYLT